MFNWLQKLREHSFDGSLCVPVARLLAFHGSRFVVCVLEKSGEMRKIQEKMRFGGLGGLGGHFYCTYYEKNSQKTP